MRLMRVICDLSIASNLLETLNTQLGWPMDEMDDEIERVRQAAEEMARLMGGRFVLSPWKLAALREATHAAAPISDNRV